MALKNKEKNFNIAFMLGDQNENMVEVFQMRQTFRKSSFFFRQVLKIHVFTMKATAGLKWMIMERKLCVKTSNNKVKNNRKSQKKHNSNKKSAEQKEIQVANRKDYFF